MNSLKVSETSVFHQMFHKKKSLEVFKVRLWTYETFYTRKVVNRTHFPYLVYG